MDFVRFVQYAYLMKLRDHIPKTVLDKSWLKPPQIMQQVRTGLWEASRFRGSLLQSQGREPLAFLSGGGFSLGCWEGGGHALEMLGLASSSEVS